MRGAKITEEKKDTTISRPKPAENKPAENISKGGIVRGGPKTELTSTNINTNTININTSTTTSGINRGVNLIKKADDKKEVKEDPKKNTNSTNIPKGGDAWRKK